jgi:hypothetical protein
MLSRCPCMKCDKRKLPCHDTCKDFKDYRAAIESLKEAKNVQRMQDAYKSERTLKYFRVKNNKKRINFF